ncbi:hypothetical protein JADG_001838 [Aureobasidium aubasidani]|nr:hypothetical protein JADG_001838 [Aureobasidium pullulans]
MSEEMSGDGLPTAKLQASIPGSVRHSKPDDSINHIEFVIYMSSSRSRERRFRLILNDIAKGLLTGKWHESIEKCQACLFVYRSDYVKAGCHLICSASAENALFHAQQAVSAYQQVYTAGEPFPCSSSYPVTKPQRITRHRLLALAIRNLMKIYQEIVTTISKEFD